MNLKEELRILKEKNVAKTPKEFVAIMKSDTDRRIKENITKNALKVGSKIPSFKLKNAVGELVDSDELLANGPLIISFYRGSWCPYCNLELVAYQEVLSEILDEGAQLVAISPQLPDASMSLIQKHELKYEILTDTENQLAKEFGLVFRLDDEIIDIYKSKGLDLETNQGNSKFELPFAATYIVNIDGTVLEAAANYDYTVRLEPSEAIEIIRNCAS